MERKRTGEDMMLRRIIQCAAVRRFIAFVCLGALGLCLYGCAQKAGTKSDVQGEGGRVLPRIAVIPFQSVIPEDVAVTYVRCPVSGTYFTTMPYSGNPESIVEEVFLRKLKTEENIILIPIERVRGVYKRICADSFTASPSDIIKKVGREVEADEVLAGYVYRYREREGYTYAVKRPASVAFGVYLFRVTDGVILWKGQFDKTQSSLMENLLDVKTFIKGRGTWVTAKQLSAVGMESILKTFPPSRSEDGHGGNRE